MVAGNKFAYAILTLCVGSSRSEASPILRVLTSTTFPYGRRPGKILAVM